MPVFAYWKYDATGLAGLVQKKEVSAAEVVEAAAQRTEELNPKLNAVIHKMYEKAKLAANAITGQEPLAGVPTFFKDLNQEIAGEQVTCGAKALQNNLAKKDATFVKRMRATGVVTLGQTNVPEFALMGVTEPELYGPTRNPWNTEYTPGGSSGGAAAAVAAGLVPIAGANDGGGSIRIPAAYCALFGLKPSRGRVPAGPYFGRHWQGASQDHVLTRSVRDSALMLDLVKGYEAGSAFAPPPFEHGYRQCAEEGPLGQLKISFSVQSPIGTKVHPDCKKAVLEAARALEALGHAVEEKEAPVDGHKIAKSYITLYFGEVAATLSSLKEVLGREARLSDVEPTTWLLGELGKVTSSKEWVLNLQEWDVATFSMEAFFEDYDLYMTPATADPPSKIGGQDMAKNEANLLKLVSALRLAGLLKKSGFVDSLAIRSLKRVPFTQLANLTGQPAMSVPLFLSEMGLPLGVHFMAAKGREDLLFRLASQLEKTTHWVGLEKVMENL